MVEPVLMPQVGQDVKTARIIKWLKKENDEVREGDVIATVDKAVLDVEAYATGVLLKILHGEGQEVDVLTPIAYIGRPGEKIDAWASPADATEAHEESVGATGTAAATRAERVGMPVSPSARRLSREKGIDPETLRGTGPGGRITKQDVLAAASARDGGPEVAEPGDDDNNPGVRTPCGGRNVRGGVPRKRKEVS